MKALWVIFVIALSITQVNAETSIAILDFELNDLTLAPGIPAEIERTASVKPLLEKELSGAGYRIISVPLADQHHANSGFGYLFDHDDVAAALGKSAGADYVVVGRLHKPSFLFAYLMGRLIRVKDGQLIGNYISNSRLRAWKVSPLKSMQNWIKAIPRRHLNKNLSKGFSLNI